MRATSLQLPTLADGQSAERLRMSYERRRPGSRLGQGSSDSAGPGTPGKRPRTGGWAARANAHNTKVTARWSKAEFEDLGNKTNGVIGVNGREVDPNGVALFQSSVFDKAEAVDGRLGPKTLDKIYLEGQGAGVGSVADNMMRETILASGLQPFDQKELDEGSDAGFNSMVAAFDQGAGTSDPGPEPTDWDEAVAWAERNGLPEPNPLDPKWAQ